MLILPLLCRPSQALDIYLALTSASAFSRAFFTTFSYESCTAKEGMR